MRRSMMVIGGIFLLFLVIGLRVHTQRGMYVFSEFWHSQPDGSYTLRDNRIAFSEADNGVQASLWQGDACMTVSLMPEGEGVRAVFDDGSEVIIQQESLLLIESNAMIQGDAFEMVFRDAQLPQLIFEGLRGEEVYPFYDEEGRELGESRSLISESGKLLEFREVWHEHPERGAAKRRVVLLQDGAVISSRDYDQGLFINEAGDYLINPEALFFIPWGSRMVGKNVVAGALIRMMTQPPASRGYWAMTLVYAALYIMGAAVFLWPEKMAFLGSRWRYQTEPELSDEGIMMEKAGGILMMAGAVFVLFYPFFQA